MKKIRLKDKRMIKLEELSASELGFLVNEGKIKPKEVVKYFEERILKEMKALTLTFIQNLKKRMR